MKIFSAIFWATIVAITMERCRAEFLLVQVDETAGRGNIFYKYIDSEMKQIISKDLDFVLIPIYIII